MLYYIEFFFKTFACKNEKYHVLDLTLFHNYAIEVHLCVS